MGSFSCNFCAYDKEEQEKEAYHTLTTKAAESAENNFKKEELKLESKELRIKKVTTENIEFHDQRLTILSEPLDTIEVNEPQISYILPKSISKRDNIEKYYQIFPTLLNTGGCSKIFVGRNEKDKFAIKQILKGGVAKPSELIREANISLQLNHKNIIKYYEIYEDINFIYFVMELGDGGDLFDFITAGENMCLSSDISIDILIQIFEAVDYLHSVKKIIHRDLKPENFLIKIDENNNPIIKLIDFGLAINFPNKGERLTEIIGTRKYASPEMICGYGYNEKIDEWAIGVVMFCMLTGYEPFRRTGQYQVEDSIVYAKIDFEIIPDTELCLLNMKLLDRNEASRITCKEALCYLRELKQKREIVYSDNYYKYQRHLFIENYKSMLRAKLNVYERKTV
jgi:serine/threonine protein kinase